MPIQLSDERKGDILRRLRPFFRETFDEELSDFQADRLLDFFLKALGPSVYNQAVGDVRKFMLEKLEDLDAEYVISEDGFEQEPA